MVLSELGVFFGSPRASPLARFPASPRRRQRKEASSLERVCATRPFTQKGVRRGQQDTHTAVFCRSAEPPAPKGGTRLSLGLNPGATAYKRLKRLTALSRASVSPPVMWGLRFPWTMRAAHPGGENGLRERTGSRLGGCQPERGPDAGPGGTSGHRPVRPWETALIPGLEIKIAVREGGGGQLPGISGQDKNSPQEQLAPSLHFGIHPQSSDLSFGFPSQPTLPGEQSSLFWGQGVANVFQPLGVERLWRRGIWVPSQFRLQLAAWLQSKSSSESSFSLHAVLRPAELASRTGMFYLRLHCPTQ